MEKATGCGRFDPHEEHYYIGWETFWACTIFCRGVVKPKKKPLKIKGLHHLAFFVDETVREYPYLIPEVDVNQVRSWELKYTPIINHLPQKEVTMRKYAAMYNADEEVWSIIFKDESEDVWFVFLSNAGDQETAKQIASAMSKRHQ